MCAHILARFAVGAAQRVGRDARCGVSTSAACVTQATVLTVAARMRRLLWYCVNLRLLLAAPLCDVCKYSDSSCCCCPAGDLEISCPQSGLFLTLTFAKDHTVKGSIEQLKPAKPPAYAAAGAAAGGASVPAPAAAASVASSSTGSGRVGGRAGRGQVVGSLEGSWMGVINVVCPSLVSVCWFTPQNV